MLICYLSLPGVSLLSPCPHRLAEHALDMVRDQGCMDVISTSFESECVKPESSIFEQHVASLGVAPSECFFIGDTYRIDVEGSLRVGIDPIWLRRDGTHATDCTVPQIASLWELMDLPFVATYPGRGA